MADIEQAPLTRRELRERERAAEAGRTPRVIPAARVTSAPASSSASVTPVEVLPEGVLPVAEPPAAVVASIASASASASPSVHTATSSSSSASSSSASASDEAPSSSRRSAASVRVRKAKAAKASRAASTATPGRSSSTTRSSKKNGKSPIKTIGAMLLAASMAVAVSLPAAAFIVDTPTAVVAEDVAPTGEGQVVIADSANLTEVVEYDSWDVASPAELKQASAIRTDSSYSIASNDGAVRWPFPVAVPISDGYGARVSPCSGCSSQHKGTDFTPGSGAPITAVADGVVSLKTTSSWGFGYHVYIDHVIDGQKVTTVYAHMQLGSSDLEVGDVVSAGDFVGLVGQTGAATGPHLHLEVRVDGVQVDPFLWLTVNAG